jgi:hypothetical protein
MDLVCLMLLFHRSSRGERTGSQILRKHSDFNAWQTRLSICGCLSPLYLLLVVDASHNMAQQLKATILERFSNNFQIWALKNKKNPIACMLLPAFGFIEGLQSGATGATLHRKKQLFGSSFCCAGGVFINDFADIEKALTEPQARDFRLGSILLSSCKLPMGPDGGRNVFLLALGNTEDDDNTCGVPVLPLPTLSSATPRTTNTRLVRTTTRPRSYWPRSRRITRFSVTLRLFLILPVKA